MQGCHSDLPFSGDMLLVHFQEVLQAGLAYVGGGLAIEYLQLKQ